MNHSSRVNRDPGLGTLGVLGLTLMLIAAAAWSLPGAAPVERQAVDPAQAFQDVRAHLAAGRLAAALAAAATIDAASLDPAAQAQLKRLTAYVRVRQRDYRAALDDYRAVLAAADHLDVEVLRQAHYSVAQLCFALEEYPAAIDHLRAWQALSVADATTFSPYILLGQSYFKSRAYPEAIDALETGVARAEQDGAQVREHWLRLLHHLYVEQRQWSDAVAVLERLARLYPSDEYDELLARASASSRP